MTLGSVSRSVSNSDPVSVWEETSREKQRMK